MSERRLETTRSEGKRRRSRLWHIGMIVIAIAGAGFASCSGPPPPGADPDYEECRWGVGCTLHCTLKYGESPYCGRN